ncbi:MAG: macro domain-containing protein [Desulfobacterales bacterium]|nr:macro domain-containing protein [Desulfobacterales bacterium]
MKIIHADLITLARRGAFDVIVHGCNCFCTMGAGIAHLIRQEFPEAYDADLKTVKGDRQKLGSFSYADIKRGKHFFTIVNGYTQYAFSGPGPLVDYRALETVFQAVKNRFGGLKIAYPKIGAGLAKGDWNTISRIIDTALNEEDHTLVIYAPKKESAPDV